MFQSRILPSRSVPMIEYSVEASRTVPMNSTASSASSNAFESNS